MWNIEKWKNEKLLLDIHTKCDNITNEILNAAIDAEQTFKCKWPYHVMITVTGGFSKKFFMLISETTVCSCSSKQVLLEILQYSQENICVVVSFTAFNFISNLSKKRLQNRWFLWKLQNFYKQLFWWNTSGGCFCQFDLLLLIKNKICGMVSTKKGL